MIPKLSEAERAELVRACGDALSALVEQIEKRGRPTPGVSCSSGSLVSYATVKLQDLQGGSAEHEVSFVLSIGAGSHKRAHGLMAILESCFPGERIR